MVSIGITFDNPTLKIQYHVNDHVMHTMIVTNLIHQSLYSYCSDVWLLINLPGASKFYVTR